MNKIITDYGLTITKTEDQRHAFIQFNTYRACSVLLKVMNEEDKEVRLLLNEELAEGGHNVCFSFGTLSGTYNIRLVVNTSDTIDIETQQIKIS